MRGFRLFFVLAAAQSALWVPLWVLRFEGVLAPPSHPPGAAWHAHEMIYGSVVAAMAGFLTVGGGGWRVAVPAAVWVAGRAALLAPEAVGPAVAAALDLAFLPLVVVLRRPVLWAVPRLMTLGIALVAAALCGVNLWLHLASLAGGDAARPTAAAAVLVAVLMSIVGGRLVPGHTRATLRRGPGLSLVGWERAGAALGAVLVAATAAGLTVAAGVAAAGLAAVQAVRLARWWDRGVLAEPLLWVLHLGFAWLTAGLGLFVAAELAGDPAPATAMHGWLVGGAGSLMLGIMARLALQHTGRPLVAPPASVAAFLLASVAAAARVVGAASGLDAAAYAAAAAAWSLAFLLFLVDHAVPLLRYGRAGALSG